jgi:hypothetical protein
MDMKLRHSPVMEEPKAILLLLVLLIPITAGCSVRRYAINMVGNALASGNSAFENDEDLDLVGEALPFGLKLMESLLAQSPDHAGSGSSSCSEEASPQIVPAGAGVWPSRFGTILSRI